MNLVEFQKEQLRDTLDHDLFHAGIEAGRAAMLAEPETPKEELIAHIAAQTRPDRTF